MTKISAVIIAHNEESKIEECLKSITWIDEIIVVDDSSTDKTVELAKKYTKNVYHHKSVGFVEPARNFAMQKASNEWILLIDADERIPAELAEHIRDIVNTNDTAAALALPRKNMIFGKWIRHTGWWPDYNVRLFKKNAVSWSNIIHSKPEIHGRLEEIPATEEMAIYHINYTSVSQFLEKMMRYTEVEAEQFVQNNKKIILTDFLRVPANEFMNRFFANHGYKDGVHGLVLSILQAISKFLVVSRVWEKQDYQPKNDKNMLAKLHSESITIYKELTYWFANELLKSEKNPVSKVRLRLKRNRSK